jgi:SAM-dependent methyltransferase
MLLATAGSLPNAVYRREFFETVMAGSPSSLLDVGCGDGALLRAAGARGCRAHGVDTDEHGIARLKGDGLSAERARAEALPFAEASFDVVTFSYTTHHLADLAPALAEALRVARRAVLILEGWYDTAMPSQRVAETYDLWSKGIDRRLGMVHNALPSAAELVALASPRAGVAAVDYGHRLVVAPWPIEEVRKAAEAQRAALGGFDAQTEDALARILEDAAREGISRDGALMMRIVKAD